MVYGRTAYNRSVYAAPAVAGLASIRLGHGLAPIPTPYSGTFGRPWSLLHKALIRAAKTSYTAGTLCAIKS
jgi:hypothetical protein